MGYTIAMSQPVNISDETYRDVQALLDSYGETVDIDTFVNRTLQKRLFFETVRKVQQRNKDVDPDVLQQEIDESIAEVRAARRQKTETSPGANRS